jgi:hypothetical protein
MVTLLKSSQMIASKKMGSRTLLEQASQKTLRAHENQRERPHTSMPNIVVVTSSCSRLTNKHLTEHPLFSVHTVRTAQQKKDDALVPESEEKRDT